MSKIWFSTEPRLQLLSREHIEKIHRSSLRVLEDVGVMIQSESALKLIADSGGYLDVTKKIARIPENLVKESLDKGSLNDKIAQSQWKPRHISQ